MKQNIQKIENDTLFTSMQNSALSTIALHGFTLGFFNVAKHKENFNHFPRFTYLFYVLPIVYNQDSMETFKSCNQLHSVLIKDSSIILGLQERANKMSTQTFDSLNLAFSKKILGLNKEDKTIETLKGFQTKKIPLPLSMNDSNNSVKKIQDCAFKLGGLFAKRDEKNIQFELNIRF
jgi:hypothetical protein